MRYHLIEAETAENHRAQEIVVFFNGWGMDENPFLDMGGMTCDLLIVSDYSSFDNSADLDTILSEYENRSLIAWSMGVWAAQLLFGHLKLFFNYSIAINGTLQPIHHRYGIDPQIFYQMSNDFSEEVRNAFYKQMCRKELSHFLEKAPRRNLESQATELSVLYGRAQEELTTVSLYDRAIISSKDLIIPTCNQKEFWQQDRSILISASHYPFQKWQSMEECLLFCQEKSDLV